MDLKSAINFEHELSSKTKGNQTEDPWSPDDVANRPKVSLSDSGLKLLELEYGYARENAVLAINQRSGMMRVYLAVIGILTGAGFALIREGNINQLKMEVLFGMSAFAVASSIYYMRGLIILRSDWRDYLTSMSRVKIAVARNEPKNTRSDLLRSLYHDPFRVPSKNLKTNFFYHSFVLCTLSMLSAFLVMIATSIAVLEPNLASKLGAAQSLLFIATAFVCLIALSLWISGKIWDAALS